MKSIKVIALSIMILFVGSQFVAAQASTSTTLAAYNAEATKKAMREFWGALNAIKAPVTTSNFYAIADQFIVIAKSASSLIATKAPKGSDAAWVQSWDKFISAAYRGVGAAGEKDIAKVKKVLEEITELNKTGHAQFK